MPMFLTILWLLFSILWGLKSLILRHKKKYAIQKTLKNTNFRFKYISYFVFAMQISLLIAMFWSDHTALLKFHNQDSIRLTGIGLCYAGLIIYLYAQSHLGKNYSPCFDSHVPFEIVSSGPYRYLRHPGWLSKFLVGVGGILAAGSLWFLPILFWILFEMQKTIEVEESYLLEAFPNYRDYVQRTYRVLPFIY